MEKEKTAKGKFPVVWVVVAFAAIAGLIGGYFLLSGTEEESEIDSEILEKIYFPDGARSGAGDTDGNVLWAYDVVQPFYVGQDYVEGSDTEGSYTYIYTRYVDADGELQDLRVLVSYFSEIPSYVEALGEGPVDFYRLSYSEMVRLWSSLDWETLEGEGDWVLAEAIDEDVAVGQQVAIRYIASMPDKEYRTDDFCRYNPMACAHSELIDMFSDGVTDFTSDEWEEEYVLVPDFLSLDLYDNE